MNTSWSLKEIYESFESEEFKKDYEFIFLSVEDFLSWEDENLKKERNKDSRSIIETYILKLKQLHDKYTRLYDYSNLTLSVNVNDEKALKYIERLEFLLPQIKKIQVNFQKYLGEFDNIDMLIDDSKLIMEHKFILEEMHLNNKYLLSNDMEEILSKMKNTGSKSWTKLQEVLTSTIVAEIELDGKSQSLPLPAIRNLAYSEDSSVRKKAYEVELKMYENIKDSVAASLNAIKGEAMLESELRGYEDIIDKTLSDSRMKKETLESMLIAIEESLPKFEEYFKAKARILGYSNGLPFYELFAPIGKASSTYDIDQAKEFIVQNFNDFSEKLSRYAKRAFENRWIDLNPKKGKRGGAFCSNVFSIAESRILTNFTGSFSDVITLAHELGHGYHGEVLKDESSLNCDYPMPIAETASIFCETIVKNSALKNAKLEEALFILEQSISDSAQVIVDIYSRFLFEKELFEKRKEGSLSVEEIKDIMITAQKKAYRNGLDHNNLHPYMWICKPHYYDAELNFYNFPYAFGLLFAKGLYSIYEDDKISFVQKYDDILRQTGKKSIEDLGDLFEIDFTKIEFFKKSLNQVEREIEQFIKLINKG